MGDEAVHSDETVKRVRQLLEEGYTHREIAAKLRVSRGFVCHVSTGRRRLEAWAGSRRSVLTGKKKRFVRRLSPNWKKARKLFRQGITDPAEIAKRLGVSLGRAREYLRGPTPNRQ